MCTAKWFQYTLKSPKNCVDWSKEIHFQYFCDPETANQNNHKPQVCKILLTQSTTSTWHITHNFPT